MDEMAHEAGMSEERAQKAMVDAARLADELRTEQELAVRYERERKLLEAQVKDIVTRCDDAEQNALKVMKHISSSLFFHQHQRSFLILNPYSGAILVRTIFQKILKNLA